MKTDAIYVGEERPRLVGKVVTTLTVTNGLDVGNMESGLRPEPVRGLLIRDVLVDTGATMLCLPADAIEELGLRFLKTVGIETATGHAQARVFANVLLEIEDRAGTFDVLELPAGSPALLGVVPLEVLGFEPDLQAQRLRKLPMDETGSYLL
ncbi:MAG TPA: aspartyl protease family protein, partial [Tepidiformaceae bacterium]|nr:aspartyl protease family protein [Tepidiformaceae bacterium]